ncbi:MAG: UDP-N-acetylmuramate dehydrogenase [Bacteroidales bacterium]|nr:UDP-N-acetylmuramate dehydrogenase [Bacteroidales bacterium]
MKIYKDFSLYNLNTFGLKVDAKYFCEVASVEDIIEANEFACQHSLKYFILGGGSNVLFCRDFDGLIIKTAFKGIDFDQTDTESIIVRASGGENWDNLVGKTVNSGFGGLENLSLIPGSVGAAPVQNIGAYGTELKDVFLSLEAFDLEKQQSVTVSKENCRFGYRSSVFKKKFKNRFLITLVELKLKKNPVLNLKYGAIREKLRELGKSEPNLKDVRDAVINIRRSKLPDPEEVGNAGSFFKNPEINESLYNNLKRAFPNIVAYPQPNGKYKVAAGWMIEQCGWKGKRIGDAGVYDKQALVLVNHGGVTSQELIELSEKIKDSVIKKFDIFLENEVNIV